MKVEMKVEMRVEMRVERGLNCKSNCKFNSTTVESITLLKRQEAGSLHCWRRLCRQKVTVQALKPFDRIAPTGNCGTPRTGNASEDWQRLR